MQPDHFTIRELWWMIRGRDKSEWSKMSVICATLHNASGFAKKSVSPDEFNPYATTRSDTRRNTSGKSIPLKMFSRHICRCDGCGRVGSKCVCK